MYHRMMNLKLRAHHEDGKTSEGDSDEEHDPSSDQHSEVRADVAVL